MVIPADPESLSATDYSIKIAKTPNGSDATTGPSECDEASPDMKRNAPRQCFYQFLFQSENAIPVVKSKWSIGKCGSDRSRKFWSIGVWVGMVFIMALTPLIMHWSYIDETGSINRGKYNPGSVHSMHFLLSCMLGQIVAFFIYGMAGVKACYNWRAFLWLSPISIIISVGEHLSLIGVAGLDPTIYAMLQKTSLAQTLIISSIMFRQRFSIHIWLLCSQLTVIVLAFVLHAATLESAEFKCDIPSLITVIVGIILTTWAVTFADWAYKKDTNPLPIQITIGRWSAASCSLILTGIYYGSNQSQQIGFFNGISGTWDYKVYILMVWLVFRDWTVTSVLKYLDAVWKATGSATAVGVLYLFEIFFWKRTPDPTLLCLVLAMVLSVCQRASLKRNPL